MSVSERFLKYISYDTQSDEYSSSRPSTAKQLNLAAELARELEELKADQVWTSGQGIVYALFHATDPSKESIGLIAHMDTAAEMSGKDVKPRIIRQYDGSEIQLNDEHSMSPDHFPQLKNVIGDDIIVTDGTTLLGNDDKAGVAIIMQTLEDMQKSGYPHGRVMAAFTTDEEIGQGASGFDLEAFDVDFAYTVDGEEACCVDYETFNAAKADIVFKGKAIHPGSAKDKMVNAAAWACRFAEELPDWMRPEHTEGREGYIHLLSVEGDCEHARLHYIIRDHDLDKFRRKIEWLQKLVDLYNFEKPGICSMNLENQYWNMKEYMHGNLEAVDKAKAALKKEGLVPESRPIRGGTDGARLTELGLITPNLGTGGGNCHGRYEFASINKMELMTRVLRHILED